MVETKLAEAADWFVDTDVALDIADPIADAEVAAAEELGTALGCTCTLSALMISAA